MASVEELTECPRCSAMVDRMARHERWHRQVEGTSDPLPPDPGFALVGRLARLGCTRIGSPGIRKKAGEGS